MKSGLTRSSRSLLAISLRATLSRDSPIDSDSAAPNEADTGTFSSHEALDFAKFRSPLSFLMENYFMSVEAPPSRRRAVEAKGAV